MLYGKLLYGSSAYNDDSLSAHGSVVTSGNASAVCVYGASASATVTAVGAAFAGVIRAASASAFVFVSGDAFAGRIRGVVANGVVNVTGAVARTRVKYASFGSALAIRASENEGLKVQSAGVFNAEQNTVEVVIQPFSATSQQAARYVFDSGGAVNRNLKVSLTSAGLVNVSFGTGSSTVSFTSSTPVPGDGGVWLGVAWDSSGVELYVDGQLDASEMGHTPVIEFGEYFYVGCSSGEQYSLDGLLEEFRASSRKRSAAEFLAAYTVGVLGGTLEWDVDTTLLLHFDDTLSVPVVRQGVWQSPALVAPEGSDYSSLVASWDDEVLPNTAVACQARTSPDGESWSQWYDVINGEYVTAPPNQYAQVRFILQTLEAASTPEVHVLVVSFEGTPEASVIYTGLSAAEAYSFAQIRDLLVICNGVDSPKKFDGETVSDITNAPRAALVTVWKNRVFMARTADEPSGLYWSGILDVDSWEPGSSRVLVNPSDGDEITALLPTASTLLIVKRHKIYQLQGYSPETFQVSYVGEGGTISPRGVADTPYGLFRLDREGIWATDLRRSVKISEEIDGIWRGLNQRALHRTALFYYDGKLLVAVPREGRDYNDLLLVYDLQHKAWTVWDGWFPACFVVYWERGKWSYLFGDSRKGNVYAIGEGSQDAGEPFEVVIETAHLPLVSEEVEKRVKWFDVSFGGAGQDMPVQAAAVVDGSALPFVNFSVSAGVSSQSFRLYSPARASSVGVRVVLPQASSEGPELLSTVLTYYQQAIRPKVVL